MNHEVSVALDRRVRLTNKGIWTVMPIKPENKHRYPANWQDVRAAILEREELERLGDALM